VKTFYVTTPIYYPNAAPHIGSTYTTALCDTLARWRRASGEPAFLVTGTDEHGEKIAETADAEGVSPQAFVDRMAERYRSTWATLGLHVDSFVRTSAPAHQRAVAKFWQAIYDQGLVEFRDYTGLYCVGCERYLTQRELENGLCIQHQRPPEPRTESNYFFKMSTLFPWLLAELESRPELIQPERYRNEVLATLRSGALEDLCITRPRERLSWGIPAPWDDGFVIYVWIDALVSYLSGCGYPDDPAWRERWDGVHHVIAKDILKPHAIFWPTMLRAAGLPLYQGLHVHGYWTMDRTKISKSLGNMVDPLVMKEKYGFEPFRYFLLREMSFGVDSDFSEEALVRRVNADLANDLGNLLSRSVSMVGRYFDGVVPAADARSPLADVAERVARDVDVQVRAFSTQRALAALWELVSAGNKHIDSEAPWQLAKDPAQRGRLASVLYGTLESLRVIAALLAPFLPESSAKILAQIGCDLPAEPLARALVWGQLVAGGKVAKGDVLFPRIEAK
jgi:methionyl-tRNA synthetase